MPKEFVFKIDGHETFRKRLLTGRCQGHTKTGLRCKRKCIIGFEYCPVHLQSIKHLKIKDSNIPNAGKGLFAVDNTLGQNAIVFETDDPIAQYNGELINHAELDRRYGEDNTAPYAVGISNNVIIDAAAERSVASIANQNPGHTNAAFVNDVARRKSRIKATRNIRNNREIYLAYGHGYRLPHLEPWVEYYTKNVTRRHRGGW